MFLDENPDISEDCDVTDLFTKYISSAADANAPVKPAKEVVKDTKGNISAEIELLNTEHEKQLDRFRATHQRYVEQLQEQHDRQIGQMEQQFDKSTAEIKAVYAQEIEHLGKENARLQRTGRTLSIAVRIETALILLLLILDALNRSVGWLRYGLLFQPLYQATKRTFSIAFVACKYLLLVTSIVLWPSCIRIFLMFAPASLSSVAWV